MWSEGILSSPTPTNCVSPVSDLHPDAKSWSWIARHKLVRVGPHDRRVLHGQVGEQDHLLHGYGVRVGHLEAISCGRIV